MIGMWDGTGRESLEHLIKDGFQFYKSTGVLTSLLLILVFQSLFPNRLAFRNLLSNWRVNLPMALINTLLVSLLCGACVCTWALTVRNSGIGLFEFARFPYWSEIIATIVLLDFVAWLWHRANHTFSFLWRFHSVHHSDAIFDASTAYRFHPGEILLALGIRLLAVALTGLPIMGLVAFEVVYGFFNLFVHSDIRVPNTAERFLGLVVVTPSLHRRHHSILREEHSRNYGTIFSCWDRLARTYLHTSSDTEINLGLPGQGSRFLKLTETLLMPLKQAAAAEVDDDTRSHP